MMSLPFLLWPLLRRHYLLCYNVSTFSTMTSTKTSLPSVLWRHYLFSTMTSTKTSLPSLLWRIPSLLWRLLRRRYLLYYDDVATFSTMTSTMTSLPFLLWRHYLFSTMTSTKIHYLLYYDVTTFSTMTSTMNVTTFSTMTSTKTSLPSLLWRRYLFYYTMTSLPLLYYDLY